MLYKLLLPVISASFIFAGALIITKILSRSIKKRVERRKKELAELYLEKKAIQYSYRNECKELQEKRNQRLLTQNKILKFSFMVGLNVFIFSGLVLIFFHSINKSVFDMIYSAYSTSAMILAIVGIRLIDSVPKNDIP